MEGKEYTSNKLAIIQVLAALMQNPQILQDSRTPVTIKDFPEQFHQIVFGAIEHLAAGGMKKIGYIDVDQFLKRYPIQYNVFNENDGINYIQKCLKVFDPDKFEYYYKTLKKHSLLNALQQKGIDTKDIYDPSIIDPKKVIQMQENFDLLTTEDIIKLEEMKMTSVKESFVFQSDREEKDMGDGIEELVDSLKKAPVMGYPMMSKKLTTIFRGIRRGCVYMVSSISGGGKTRFLVGEACNLAVPEKYDIEKKKWVKTGIAEKVLLIETELELGEVQTMAMANISGVPEGHILDGIYEPGEEERVRKAARLIKESNFKVVAITDYNTEELISIIKKYHQQYQTDYVFYDYLSENIKILAEVTSKTKTALRTDQILLSMVTALKDCAKLLNIFIFTATQTSGDLENAKKLDASFLRSAKSLADKVDCAAILIPVREADQNLINTYCAKGFEVIPDFILSVYKVRRGSYQNIKLFIKFDRGICRMYDAFVANARGELLAVEDTNIEFVLDDTKEEKLNNILDDNSSDEDFDF